MKIYPVLAQPKCVWAHYVADINNVWSDQLIKQGSSNVAKWLSEPELVLFHTIDPMHEWLPIKNFFYAFKLTQRTSFESKYSFELSTQNEVR